MERRNPIIIEYTDGECYSLEANGKQFADLSQEDMKNLCHEIIDNYQISGATMQRLVELFVESDAEGKHEDLGNLTDRYIVTI